MEPFSMVVNYGLQTANVSYSPAQTITLPFEFEPYPLGTPTTPQLLPDFGSVDFVNGVGNSALTIFSMLDALAFLGILIVIYLAVKVLVWLYRFVTELPTGSETLNVSGVLNEASDASGDEENIYSTAGRVLNLAKKSKRNNPFKF